MERFIMTSRLTSIVSVGSPIRRESDEPVHPLVFAGVNRLNDSPPKVKSDPGDLEVIFLVT